MDGVHEGLDALAAVGLALGTDEWRNRDDAGDERGQGDDAVRAVYFDCSLDLAFGVWTTPRDSRF